MDLISSAGDAGNSAYDDSRAQASTSASSRGRVRGNDFGLPSRAGLIDLARTYLETQARLWPELAGTPAVPVADDDRIEAMADDFERRFRSAAAEVFGPDRAPRCWSAVGIAYLRFSDENSNPRSLDQQLNNVLARAGRERVFVPWGYVLADAAVSGTLACRRGYMIAKSLVERREETGAAWFFVDDLSRMSRNTIESLRLGELAGETGVRLVGATDGFDSSNPQSTLLLPMLGSFNEAFIHQLKAKVKRGMDDAFRRGDNIHPPGVGYRLVDVKDTDGNLVLTRKGTIKKRVEIDPEAAEWTRRGAEMIAHEGKSAGDVARIFNENKVGGKQTWTDGRVRQHYRREKLVGRDILHKTKQVIDRQTGRKKVVHLPEKDWLVRSLEELRILTDELAGAVLRKLSLGAASFGPKAKRARTRRVDVYPKVLIRPVCGCCQSLMVLGRSLGKYQSFVCSNAIHGVKGCTNRGYKSARIIDEAVLGTVMARLFDDAFIDRLTEEVNEQLSQASRRPLVSTAQFEREIAARERQVARLTAKLEREDDDRGLDAIFDRVREMEKDLASKRDELTAIRQRNRRPKVGRVKRQEVVAALGNLRELLQGDVAVASEVLKALIGDVVIEAQPVEGEPHPRMVARFVIDAVPALAELGRRKEPSDGGDDDDPTDNVWEFLNGDRWIMSDGDEKSVVRITVPLSKPRKYELVLSQVAAMADAGTGSDLISRALGISVETVNDALHLHRTGRHPPKRIDPRRGRHRPKVDSSWVPTYKQISAEVDRRRKAGESFEHLARAIGVSRGTIVRAYEFANRAEALAAAREGRAIDRPAFKSCHVTAIF